MSQTDLNHHETARSSLAGERAIDEATFASIAILESRLKRLRERNEVFADVTFSPAVQKLAAQEAKVAVG